MEDLLLVCCKTILIELQKLKDEGKITHEDYEKHTVLKKEFVELQKNKKENAHFL